MTDLDIINRLENLENQNVHLHQHLETIIVLLYKHDSRLINFSKMDDTYLDIDRIEEWEQYSPINKIDKLKKETKLKELREEREETEQELLSIKGIRSDLNE